MLAAVGPFALENGLVAPDPQADKHKVVRILNTNTNKLIQLPHGGWIPSGS
jgi:2-methylaconitate cis-trans-isomerase PrpF